MGTKTAKTAKTAKTGRQYPVFDILLEQGDGSYSTLVSTHTKGAARDWLARMERGIDHVIRGKGAIGIVVRSQKEGR